MAVPRSRPVQLQAEADTARDNYLLYQDGDADAGDAAAAARVRERVYVVAKRSLQDKTDSKLLLILDGLEAEAQRLGLNRQTMLRDHQCDVNTCHIQLND